MKLLKLTYLLALLLALQATSYAVESEAEETTGNFQQQDDDLDQLEKILDISEVKEIKKQCEAETPPAVRAGESSDGGDTGSCIWRLISRPENSAIQEKVQAQMDETLEEFDGISQHESVKVVSLKKDDSESLKALELFYAEKLQKELYGEATGSNDLTTSKAAQIIDHKKFNKIFENQMTKNILSAVSTYCIEAEMIGTHNFPMLKKNDGARRAVRKANLTKLSGAELTKVDANGNSVKVSALKNSSQEWQSCMVNIQYVCHGGKKHIKDDKGKVKTDSAGNPISVSADDEFDAAFPDAADAKKLAANKAYSKMRACEVTNYLKVAKQNLKAIERISEGYKELEKTSGYGLKGQDIKNKVIAEEIVLDKGKLDNITSTSSNEFANESGFGEKVNTDLVEFEKCFAENSNGAFEVVPGSEDLCKKYLNTDHEAVEKIKQEHALRQNALALKVSKLKDGSEDELKQFLLDQGRDEEEVDEQLKNIDIDALKLQITERYTNEKEQLIKSLNAKLDAQTSKNSGKIVAVDDNSKLKKIHTELSNKTESYAQLIHYNNMITGLLDIKDEDGKSRRNTASIQREMESNSFSEANVDNLDLSDSDKQAYISATENLQEVVKSENIADSSDSSSSNQEEETTTTIGVDKINEEILNYDIEPNTP